MIFTKEKLEEVYIDLWRSYNLPSLFESIYIVIRVYKKI